jgi:hypothetical protein
MSAFAKLFLMISLLMLPGAAYAQTPELSFWLNKSPSTWRGNHVFLTYLQSFSLSKKSSNNKVSDSIFKYLSNDLTKCDFANSLVRYYSFTSEFGRLQTTEWYYTVANCNVGTRYPYQVLYAYRTGLIQGFGSRSSNSYYIIAVSYVGNAAGGKSYANMGDEDAVIGGPRVGDVRNHNDLKQIFASATASSDLKRNPYCRWVQNPNGSLRVEDTVWWCS